VKWIFGSVIDISNLTIGALVGSGGQAEVLACAVNEASGSKESDRWLFKQYTTVRPNLAAMQSLVEWPATLDDYESILLAESCAWPIAVVIQRDGSDSSVVGVVIPRAPERFAIPAAEADGDSRLRELQYLIRSSRSEKLGVSLPTHSEVLKILERFAELMALFDRHDIVHGDISMRNVLFSSSPPSSFLLDCDSAWIAGSDAGFSAVTTPGWTDPRILDGTIHSPDLQSDRFGLAAAIYRSYYRVAGSDLGAISHSIVEDRAPTSPRMLELLESAFTGTDRPSPTQWQTVLQNLRTGDYAKPTPRYERPKPMHADEQRPPAEPIAATSPAATTQIPRRPSFIGLRSAPLVYLAVALCAVVMAIAATALLTNQRAVTPPVIASDISTNTQTPGVSQSGTSIPSGDPPEASTIEPSVTPSPLPNSNSVTPPPQQVDTSTAIASAAFRRQTVEVFSCRHATRRAVTVLDERVLLFDQDPPIPSWWIELTARNRSTWTLRQINGSTIAIRDDIGVVDLSESAIVRGSQVVIVEPSGAASTSEITRVSLGEFETDQTSRPEPGSVALDSAGRLLGLVGFVGGTAVVTTEVSMSTGSPLEPGCGDVPTSASTSHNWTTTDSSSAQGLLAMQRLSDAFADADWVAVRSIDRAKAINTDQVFREGWGQLNESTVWPVELLWESGTTQRWRLGLLGHETLSGRNVSTLYCVTWEVNTNTGTVVQLGGEAIAVRSLENALAGWLPFEELAARLRNTC